jgi:hypothetical protein
MVQKLFSRCVSKFLNFVTNIHCVNFSFHVKFIHKFTNILSTSLHSSNKTKSSDCKTLENCRKCYCTGPIGQCSNEVTAKNYELSKIIV